MHELSICHSIAGIVTKHAKDRTVQEINLRVGQLRQIVPDTLVYCWSLVSKDTPLDGSELRVESIPAEIRCTACSHITRLKDKPFMRCAECGGQRVEVIAGEEFLITSLELKEA